MTKAFSVGIAGHTEYRPDKGTIGWPAADGSGALPNLGYDYTDYIVGNATLDTVVTSTDGSLTLTFGASLVSGSFVGTASDNTVTDPYSGPYASVHWSRIDFTDPAFRDVILLGIAASAKDPHSKVVPIDWLSGPSRSTGLHIVTGSVGRRHTNNEQVNKFFVQASSWFYITSSNLSSPFDCSLQFFSNVTRDYITAQDNSVIAGPLQPGGPAGIGGNFAATGHAGDWILWDPTGTNLLTSAATGWFSCVSALDMTTFAYDGFLILGHISEHVDTNTGQYKVHAYHANLHQVQGDHVADTSVDATHLYPIGSAAASTYTSAQDTPSITNATTLTFTSRNFGGTAPPAAGSSSGGNLTGFHPWSMERCVEIRVADDALASPTLTWTAWQRLEVSAFVPVTMPGTPTFPRYVTPGDPGHSVSGLDIVVTRFEPYADGTVACVYEHDGSSGIAAIGVQFRIAHGIHI